MRRINIRLLVAETKPGRKNADDGIVDAVQCDELAERRGVAGKPVLPQTIADDDGRRSADAVFLRREITAKGQLHAQSAEETRRDFLAVNMLRRAGIRDRSNPCG